MFGVNFSFTLVSNVQKRNCLYLNMGISISVWKWLPGGKLKSLKMSLKEENLKRFPCLNNIFGAFEALLLIYFNQEILHNQFERQ